MEMFDDDPEIRRQQIHDKAMGMAIKITVVVMTIWLVCLALLIMFVPCP